MVCNDTDGLIRSRIAALVLLVCQSHYPVQDVADGVNIENGLHILHDTCDSLQTHTGINVRMLQIAVASVLLPGELSEYVIPELDIPVAVTPRLAVRLAAAVFRSSVEVNLRARTARTQSDLPEVVFLSQMDDPLLRHSQTLPDIHRFLVIQINRSPDLLFRNLQHFRDEFPAPCQGFLFEVIPEREVAHHLEERAVTGRDTDVFDIIRTDALLTGGHPLLRRRFHTAEVILQRRHAGIDNQQ